MLPLPTSNTCQRASELREAVDPAAKTFPRSLGLLRAVMITVHCKTDRVSLGELAIRTSQLHIRNKRPATATQTIAERASVSPKNPDRLIWRSKSVPVASKPDFGFGPRSLPSFWLPPHVSRIYTGLAAEVHQTSEMWLAV